jgi:uncharacterized OsmC-like protein
MPGSATTATTTSTSVTSTVAAAADQTQSETLNGVPVSAISALVTAIEADASKAATTWKAVSEWKGGFKCHNTIRDKHELVLDEPAGLGGSDAGPNMVEFIASALGSCLTVGHVLNASRRNLNVSNINVDITGKLNLEAFLGIHPEQNAGFSQVDADVTFELADTNIDASERKLVHDLTVASSPVGSILTHEIKVDTQLIASNTGSTDATETAEADSQASTTINGVPVSAVQGLVDAVSADSKKANTVWKSNSSWAGSAFQCNNQIRGHSPVLDEPKSLGSSDAGPNMVEGVLAAYGSCLIVGTNLALAKAGIQTRSIRVESQGSLDLRPFLGIQDGNAGFDHVQATVYLDADADQETLQNIFAKVVQTSPVGSILRRSIPLNINLKEE